VSSKATIAQQKVVRGAAGWRRVWQAGGQNVSSDMPAAQQNDPHELLEVFDAAGQPTGVAKSRAAVHVDGDWHQAFHCWIVRPGPEVVLQRRSLLKDTFAGYWDASAAGHWRFGETALEASREIAEELGIDFDFAALRYRGHEPLVQTFDNGLIDREHHQVYVLPLALPLQAYRPNPAEVSALAAVPGAELIALLAGQLQSVRSTEAVTVRTGGALSAAAFDLRREELVPYSPARLRRNLGLGEGELLDSRRYGSKQQEPDGR
jgi:isopentenyldiphosphate isomerase